ncbi:hypothetical protein [Methanoregula sp.]|jgi:hypothetical protein|uniref:hypothetical protein n=1 Tax=Methanoregula sp. TaxID=2052170 RepID=UPI003562A79D
MIVNTIFPGPLPDYTAREIVDAGRVGIANIEGVLAPGKISDIRVLSPGTPACLL